MKYIFIILSVAILITACSNGGGTANGGKNSGSRATSTEQQTSPQNISESYTITDSTAIADTINLGRIHSGEIVGRSIELCNGTTTPIVILSVGLSCGCTSVNFDKQPIQPAKCATLSFEFNSKGFNGFQMKNITINSSASSKPNKIVLIAEVE